MSMTIDEAIQLKASPAQTWTALQDAQLIVRCLPGAKLVRMINERRFVSQMKAKLGSVRVVYKGELGITDLFEDELRMLIHGKWRERGGSGSAELHMTIKVKPLDDGTEVSFDGKVDVVGRIVNFSRGMMNTVSKELFKQFADKMRAELEASSKEAESAAEETAAPAPVEEQAPEAAPAEAATEAPAEAQQAQAHAQLPVVSSAATEAAVKAAAEAAKAAAAAAEAARAAAEASAAVARAIELRYEEEEEEEGLNVVALTFKALWNSIAGFFRGIFGGGSR